MVQREFLTRGKPVSRVKVELRGDIWHAAHFDDQGEPDAQVIDLFGTHVLPTPFFLPTPREKVEAQLRATGNNIVWEA